MNKFKNTESAQLWTITALPITSFLNFTKDRKLVGTCVAAVFFLGLSNNFEGLWKQFEGLWKHFLTELGVCGTFFTDYPTFLLKNYHRLQVAAQFPHTPWNFQYLAHLCHFDTSLTIYQLKKW